MRLMCLIYWGMGDMIGGPTVGIGSQSGRRQPAQMEDRTMKAELATWRRGTMKVEVDLLKDLSKREQWKLFQELAEELMVWEPLLKNKESYDILSAAMENNS